MTLLQAFECGPVATFSYLLCTPASGTAVLIDAPYGSVDLVCDEADRHGCRITDLLLTHTHWDHTADAAAIVRRTGARVYVHPADVYRLTDPMAHTVWPLPFDIEPVTPDQLIDQGAVLDVAGLRLRVLHTPGHTEGGVCFVDDAHARVFVGDTLFAGSVGRVDLPGGDEDTLIESIRTRLFALPDDMVAWPGHGPSTTIGRERKTNPFAGEGTW
jgi:hydroxyacylglutathione hydrolase